MIVEQSRQKCAHKPCSCDVQAGKAYCSPACEDAATAHMAQGDIRTCGCGHDACANAAQHDRRAVAA